MQNYCLDALENLVRANMLPVNNQQRFELQQEAGKLLELLGYFAMICMETGCILPNQFENISKLQAESLLFLGKWITSENIGYLKVWILDSTRDKGIFSFSLRTIEL